MEHRPHRTEMAGRAAVDGHQRLRVGLTEEEPACGTADHPAVAGAGIGVCQQRLDPGVLAQVAGDDAQGAGFPVAWSAVVHPEAGEVEHVGLGGASQDAVPVTRAGVEDGNAKEFAASEAAQGQTDGGGRGVQIVAVTDEFGRHPVRDGCDDEVLGLERRRGIRTPISALDGRRADCCTTGALERLLELFPGGASGAVLLREREHHATDEWIAAVERTRAALGIEGDSPTDVDRRLAAFGFARVVAVVREQDRQLVGRTGLHDRYVEYFAACVVSQFADGDRHALPARLKEGLRRQRSAESPVPPGMVRLEFTHGKAAVTRPTVESVEQYLRMQLVDVPSTAPSSGAASNASSRTPSAATAAADPDWSISVPYFFVVTPHAPESAAGVAPSSTPQVLPIHDLQEEMRSADWVPAPLPYGLDVRWPYETPMLSPTESELFAMRADLGLAGLVARSSRLS